MPSADYLYERKIAAAQAAAGTPFGQAGSATPSTVIGSAANQYGAQTKTVTIDGKTITGIDPTTGKPPAATTIGMVSPSSGLTITGTERNAAKEAEARAIGYTKEYLASRGGINSQGYFNDTPISGQLTAEEQKQVRLPNGNTDTQAMADILQKKQIAELVSKGLNVSEATKQVSAQYGQFGVPVSGSSDMAGNDPTGAAGAAGADSSKLGTTPTTDTKKVDQIAAISSLLSSYGLGDLTGAITEAVQKGYSNDTIQLIMQEPNSKDPLAVEFKTRISGNKERFAAGKPVLSPGEYLAAERTYSQVLQSYGVGTLAKKETMSSFIAGDISAAEVADRVGLAIDRVKNADPFTKAALADYYPSLNQTDIVSALLDPAEGLPALKRKVQIAEIGGAARVQGLTTGLATTSGLASGYQGVTTGSLGAESLAQYGITQEEARKGYQAVAEIAPRAEFLSSISGGEDYTRLEAEQEAFLGLASAKRKRLSLTEQEQSRFAGQSGTAKTSLSNMGQGQY